MKSKVGLKLNLVRTIPKVGLKRLGKLDFSRKSLFWPREITRLHFTYILNLISAF